MCGCGSSVKDTGPTGPTNFQLTVQTAGGGGGTVTSNPAGITWKIYVNTTNSGCSSPYQASCLIKLSYLQNFTFAQTRVSTYPQNIQPIDQYFADLTNGTLPQVSEIEPASDAGRDEHGSDADSAPINVQLGEAYVESLINALMDSASTCRLSTSATRRRWI